MLPDKVSVPAALWSTPVASAGGIFALTGLPATRVHILLLAAMVLLKPPSVGFPPIFRLCTPEPQLFRLRVLRVPRQYMPQTLMSIRFVVLWDCTGASSARLSSKVLRHPSITTRRCST